MSDEDSRVDPKAVAAGDHYGESLLYDFAKFVTTLGLLALGGLLTITQTADLRDVKPVIIGFVFAAIAVSLVLAVSSAHALVDARAAGQEPRASLAASIKYATLFLAMGTGGFMMIWWDSLS